MGFFKVDKEKQAYREILKKKTTLASRQAYADESVKVAADKARARAKRKSIGEILSERITSSVQRRAAGTSVRRASPTRRRVVKRKATTKRKVTKKRASPKRRKAVKKRIASNTPKPQGDAISAIYGY